MLFELGIGVSKQTHGRQEAYDKGQGVCLQGTRKEAQSVKGSLPRLWPVSEGKHETKSRKTVSY